MGMIDEKYEGHTPERWTVDEEDPCRVIDVQECTIARTDFLDIDEEREWQLANAQLIADAPLLLAEVKRLREALVGDSKDWTTDELVEKIFTLYDKAHAWNKMVEYYSENEGTEDDSQADYEMREEMERVLEEVKK